MSRFFPRRITPAQVVILGFLVQILAGALLLSLPAATRTGQSAPFSCSSRSGAWGW